jgi:hypothetical protein
VAAGAQARAKRIESVVSVARRDFMTWCTSRYLYRIHAVKLSRRCLVCSVSLLLNIIVFVVHIVKANT